MYSRFLPHRGHVFANLAPKVRFRGHVFANFAPTIRFRGHVFANFAPSGPCIREFCPTNSISGSCIREVCPIGAMYSRILPQKFDFGVMYPRILPRGALGGPGPWGALGLPLFGPIWPNACFASAGPVFPTPKIATLRCGGNSEAACTYGT